MAAKKILVVDDSKAMRKSAMFALQRLPGVVCAEASDGAEGLVRLAAERFDLVIVDINMPVLDGLKLLGAIRQSPEHRGVAVVVITTESAVADRNRALALGANAYMVKPLQAQAVIDVVRKVLGLP